MRPAFVVAAAAAAVLGAAGAAPAEPGTVTVVATGLDNPRQVSASPSGAIYVAEAGKAGPTCPTKDVCVGRSGAVVRWQAGTVRRVLRGLPSLAGKDGTFAVGPDGVSAAAEGTLFVAMTGAPCATRLPRGLRPLLGRVLRTNGAGGTTSVADISRIECTTNPDKTDRNPNPYAVLALSPTHAIVVDAGGNAVYDVDGATARLLAVIPKLPSGAQSVPTAIALGPDGAYYVGEFGGEAKRELKDAQRIFRIDPAGGRASVFATGFSAVSGLAFDSAGTMYVTEASIAPTNPKELRGVVVRVPADGSPRTQLGLGKLFFPAGAAVGADGALYVANYSVLPGSTPKQGRFHGAGGQLVRIALA